MHSPSAQFADFLQNPVPEKSQCTRLVGITALNGAATLNGHSGELGDPHDQALLRELRQWSQAVIVSARTAQIEAYRRPTAAASSPLLVLLSHSLDLDFSAPIFSRDPGLLPLQQSLLIATNSTDTKRIAELSSQGIPVLQCLSQDFSGLLAQVHTELRQRGYQHIVVEGGPQVYSAALQAQILDELIVTLAPHVVLPGNPTLFADSDSELHKRLALLSLRSIDSMVYLRYKFS